MAIVERELTQLEWLIRSEQNGEEDIGRGDIHAQISRLCGLTDLAHPDGLPVSETTRTKLHQQSEAAMSMVRSKLSSN